MSPRLALVALVVLSAIPAKAARAEGVRVAIGQVRGPGAAAFEAALGEALADQGDVLVDESEVEAAVRRYGRSRWVRVMAEVDADVLLVGRIARQGRRLRLDARAVVRGRGGQRLRAQGEGPGGLAARVVEALDPLAPARSDEGEAPSSAPEDGRAAASLDRASALATPEASAELPEATAMEDVAASSAEDTSARGTVFETFVAGGTLMRKLLYTDDIFDRLAQYSLGAAPTLDVGGRLHPFATLDIPFLRDLGVEIGASVSRVQGSERDGALTHPTVTHAFWFAGRYRLPLGPHQLTASVGMARRSFELGPSGPANPMNDPLSGVPGVAYKMVMFEVGSRLAFGSRVRMEAAGRYLVVRDAGGMTSDIWFPRATVRSFGARFALDVRLTSSLWLTARVALERHAFTMHPERGDRWVAGGAVDLYLSPTLGALVQY